MLPSPLRKRTAPCGRTAAILLAGTLLGVFGPGFWGSTGATASAQTVIVRPGAPGEATRAASAADVAPPHPHTAADVRFMQDMVVHHYQALEMSGLIEGRTENPELLLLGRRILVSQEDEIRIARTWLEERGEAVPEPVDHGRDPHGADHHGADHAGTHTMAGMLTPAQMEHLATARGAEFDILFLAAMIQHHEGALVMVADLFDSPGAGQEEEVFQFASHVEADQRIEIARMQRMLTARLSPGR